MKVHRSQNGMIFGVCRGLEESLGIPAKYIRIGLIIAAVLFRAWFVLALYLAAALLLPVSGSDGWKFQDNFESLGKEAGERGRREYREFMQSMKSSRKSWNTEEEETAGRDSVNP